MKASAWLYVARTATPTSPGTRRGRAWLSQGPRSAESSSACVRVKSTEVFVNRREALMKIGAGGVMVVAGPAIISSIAFADGGSPNSLPSIAGPSATYTKAGGVLAITTVASTCPFGSPASAKIQFGTSINTDPGGLTYVGLTSRWATAPVTNVSWGTTTNTTVVVRLDLRYVCQSRPRAGATKAWRCASYLITVAVLGSGQATPSVASTGNPTALTGIGPLCDDTGSLPAIP